MADRDWDLSAVVRSCSNAAASASASEAENQKPHACPPALTFPEDDCTDGGQSFPFESVFPNLFQPQSRASEDLHQLCRQFLTRPDNPNLSPSGEVLRPNPASVHRRIAPAPPPNPSLQHERQTPLQHGRQQHGLHVSGHKYQPLAPPSAQPPQTPRTRKRKSQQKKNVCHVSAENLSSDPWAWRKYGQKPIKGSPYPRNYYRCSSSKGCVARKQVERSNTDPNIFIVTYTGEHTHLRPTHRNSLAGSTRNKFTGALQKAPTTSSNHPEDSRDKPASLSPTTPLTAPIDDDGTIGRMKMSETRSDSATIEDNNKEIGEIDMLNSDDEPDDDLDDEDLLIPNIANNMREDIFEGFHDLINNNNNYMPNPSYGFGQGSGSGDNFLLGKRN